MDSKNVIFQAYLGGKDGRVVNLGVRETLESVNELMEKALNKVRQVYPEANLWKPADGIGPWQCRIKGDKGTVEFVVGFKRIWTDVNLHNVLTQNLDELKKIS